MKSLFITGTDTDVGKSLISAAVLRKFGMDGLTVGYKPVSAGCDEQQGRLVNGDAQLLQRYGSLPVSLGEVNPIAFKAPVAPHLAASNSGVSVSVQRLLQGYHHLASKQPDWLLVEGAGGWRLPLGNDQFMPDLVTALGLPVVLVVGLKLGCINHTLLTVEAIQRDGLPLVAWVGNSIDPQMALRSDNVDTLKTLIPAPCLGIVPHLQGDDDSKVAAAGDYLDVRALTRFP